MCLGDFSVKSVWWPSSERKIKKVHNKIRKKFHIFFKFETLLFESILRQNRIISSR